MLAGLKMVGGVGVGFFLQKPICGIMIRMKELIMWANHLLMHCWIKKSIHLRKEKNIEEKKENGEIQIIVVTVVLVVLQIMLMQVVMHMIEDMKERMQVV